PYGDGSAFTRRAYIYDELDELRQTLAQPAPDTAFADWPSTQRFYDLNRNLIRLVEPDGPTTQLGYDPRNYPPHATRGFGTPDAITEHHVHDLEGKKTSFTDGRGGVWTTAYDGFGRVAKTTDPLGNQATVSYDDDGNPTVTGAYQAPEQQGGDSALL